MSPSSEPTSHLTTFFERSFCIRLGWRKAGCDKWKGRVHWGKNPSNFKQGTLCWKINGCVCSSSTWEEQANMLHLYQKANVSRGVALWKAAKVYKQMVFEHLTTAIQAWLGSEHTRGPVYPRALDSAAAPPVLVEIFKHRYALWGTWITILDGQGALSPSQWHTPYTISPGFLRCWSAF